MRYKEANRDCRSCGQEALRDRHFVLRRGRFLLGICAGLGLYILGPEARLASAQEIPTHVIPAGGKAPASPFQILTVGEAVISNAVGPLLGLGFAQTFSSFLVLSQVATDLDPNTLNLKSQGKFVTVSFEISGVKSADQINPASLAIMRINDQDISPIPSEPKPVALEDTIGDGQPELIVKFDRQALIKVLPVSEQVKVTLEGMLQDGSPFKVDGFIRTIQPGAIPSHQGGAVSHPSGARIEVAGGAMSEDGDLHIVKLSAAAQKHQQLRDLAAKKLGRNLLGAAYEFGPEGKTFAAPVTIAIPYDPSTSPAGAEGKLQIAYWNPATQIWEPLQSFVDTAAKMVLAKTDHFSLYQIVAPAAETAELDSSFALRQVYVYPNPAVRGAKPTFHLEIGVADSIVIQIYNTAGQQVAERRLSGAPNIINGRYAYEVVWDGHIPSGVYVYTVKAERSGQGPIQAAGKCAVVR